MKGKHICILLINMQIIVIFKYDIQTVLIFQKQINIQGR